MERGIKNAVIDTPALRLENGVLTAYLFVRHSDGSQGFGGFALYLPKGYKHHDDPVDYCGHFIYRVLEIAGVENWDNLEGKAIRVDADRTCIHGIGHIIKNDWFYPDNDFDKMRDLYANKTDDPSPGSQAG